MQHKNEAIRVRLSLQEQYIYLHEVVAEALLVGTQHVWAQQFQNVYNYMISKEKGSVHTRIEEQYKVSMIIVYCHKHNTGRGLKSFP